MRLLLVEDDVMVASGIKLGLTDAGYAVDWVGSAERALEVTKTETFDLAVVDIGLPAMDGLALTQRLRKDGHAMPVLILTARDALQDRVQGLDVGADGYLVKPFELPELLARLRALLRRSQAATSATLAFGPRWSSIPRSALPACAPRLHNQARTERCAQMLSPSN
jgi:two-component system, OmpR family, response regulator